MIIAVASGKGGTGKTTVAVSLAAALTTPERRVIFLDTDVEAPNAHIFLHPDLEQQKPVTLLVPQVDTGLCSGCGRCAEVCQYHAIVVINGGTLVFPQLCHGCGSCTLVCPEKAITEVPQQLGVLEKGHGREGLIFAQGLLDVGEPMAVPLISQLKKWAEPSDPGLVIRDCPPGASCPVVASIRGADYVLLVTEPTPFGLHDLKLAVQLTEELGIPAGVVINRDGIGDRGVDRFCSENNLPVLLRIPFDRQIGRGIAQGKTLLEIRPEFTQQFIKLYELVSRRVQGTEVPR